MGKKEKTLEMCGLPNIPQQAIVLMTTHIIHVVV